MSTPSRYSGGLAYIWIKRFVSLQYDLVSYQKASFDIGNGDINFINQNEIINTKLKSAGTLKIGSEYRLGRLSLDVGISIKKVSIENQLTSVRIIFWFGI